MAEIIIGMADTEGMELAELADMLSEIACVDRKYSDLQRTTIQ